MKSKKIDSVDAYLTSLDPKKELTIRSIIALIVNSFPELESKISWNVPQIHHNGKYVFGVSALKNHIALAPWSTQVIEDFRERLEKDNYIVKQNLFQIPVDWEIDKKLVLDLVTARLAELLSK